MLPKRYKRKDVLFVLTEEDAQTMAKELFGRRLRRNELDTVKQLVEWGLEGWQYVLEDAIQKAAKVGDPWYWMMNELSNVHR